MRRGRVLLILCGKEGFAMLPAQIPNCLVRENIRQKHIAGRAVPNNSPDAVSRALLGNKGQVYMQPTPSSKQISTKVILMQPLMYDDDHALGRIVETRCDHPIVRVVNSLALCR